MKYVLVSGCLAVQTLAGISLSVCYCLLVFGFDGSPNGGLLKCFVFVLNLFLMSFKFAAVSGGASGLSLSLIAFFHIPYLC